jgi:hypothetical protein
MHKDDRPSQIEKSMMVKVPAPEGKIQRPYLVAFRKFILNPENKNQENEEWKSPQILNELWKLWIERPKVKASESSLGLDTFFHQRHRQSIQRQRMKSPPASFDDGLLFTLVQRFLKSNGVIVPSFQLCDSFRALSANLGAILPRAHNLPLPILGRPTAGIKLYTVKSELTQEADPIYLALSLTKKYDWSCPAIVFTLQHLDVYAGLYFFLSRECFLRKLDTQMFRRYTVVDTMAGMITQIERVARQKSPASQPAPTSDELMDTFLKQKIERESHMAGRADRVLDTSKTKTKMPVQQQDYLFQDYVLCERADDVVDARQFAEQFLSFFL